MFVQRQVTCSEHVRVYINLADNSIRVLNQSVNSLAIHLHAFYTRVYTMSCSASEKLLILYTSYSLWTLTKQACNISLQMNIERIQRTQRSLPVKHDVKSLSLC